MTTCSKMTSFRHLRRRLGEHVRKASTIAQQKREGTIADAFASLSGQHFGPLEPRFASVKSALISEKEDAVQASWARLLSQLQKEVDLISRKKSSIIPMINFKDVDSPPEAFAEEYRKRGVAVIRNVIPEEEVLDMKNELKKYIVQNPQTKAFPADNPQVYELYWSPAQIRARAHPNLLKAQSFLLSFWRSKDPDALVSSKPIAYADRLRMRQPGDAKFALGPHIDGGSCERWESQGYGKGKVYEHIWNGNWEQYDPWESSCRLPVESDLYNGAGACSAFRMAQGWLSMSSTGPCEGTLLVNPLLQLATAYFLLRPFFTPRTQLPAANSVPGDPDRAQVQEYLAPENWILERPISSWLHGANLGRGQELNEHLHPHLDLAQTMVHVPHVRPGDYVVWHCDTIHAVDKVHAGKSDSSVLYIPACPLTEANARYLVRQRECFLKGLPSPDFPGGLGESKHVGRPTKRDVGKVSGRAGLSAMGLEPYDVEERGLSPSEVKMLKSANSILGFA